MSRMDEWLSQLRRLGCWQVSVGPVGGHVKRWRKDWLSHSAITDPVLVSRREGEPVTDALRPMTKQRLYEQVLDRLRQYVAEGGLRAGDRLPPERDLAQRLGVSRASVKQAI